MLKKLLLSFALLFSFSPVYSAEIISELIGPTHVSQTSVLTTFSAPGLGYRNCITDVVIVSTHNLNFNILSGGTTMYGVDIATSTAYLPLRTAPFIDKWPKDDPLCAEENTALRFGVLNSTGSVAPYRLNYRGHIRKRQ